MEKTPWVFCERNLLYCRDESYHSAEELIMQSLSEHDKACDMTATSCVCEILNHLEETTMHVSISIIYYSQPIHDVPSRRAQEQERRFGSYVS